MEEAPTVYLWNVNNITDPGPFNITLAGLMNRLVNQAVSSSNFFAAEDVNQTVFIRIYGLVQCTPDIMPSDCNICLSNCVSQIPKCCNGKQGGRVNSPSCNIRFETYPFYTLASPPSLPPSPPENATPPPPPPPPPPPAFSTNSSGNGQISSDIAIAITIPTIFFAVFVSASCYFLLTRTARRKNKSAKKGNVGDEISMMESIQFDLHTIESATNSFSDGNKIGQGGFGSVYRGTLYNGQEVAVKRLSRSSGQGAEEFKNEVALVAKLQHRNLVRLLGFCQEGGEKILIYEFVPNKSLDYFLFDPEKQGILDWSSRVDQSQGSTNRIVGTYGYMPPELCRGPLELCLETLEGQDSSGVNRSNFTKFFFKE
ncbi:hypothetical protein QYF36_007617 [Acer negundo]|nr:hypothetical protein QYF36_007617 [Acer negundo]